MVVVRELDSSPSLLPLYAKAALPAIPGVGMLPGVRRSGRELPDVELVRRGVTADRDHVAEYADVCGFALRDTLPATYPHLLAFPLQMALMSDRSFPFAAMGLVHVQNRIRQHRPIRGGERLDLSVRTAGLRPHRKGRQFDVVTEVRADDELVWHEVSTFLRRGGDGSGEGPASLASPAEAVGAANTATTATTANTANTAQRWALGADLGRRYAAASGDRNPIHLYRLTARAFGFPRQIAHGMWSKARCLAALELRLPAAYEIAVTFQKPLMLPGSVSFGAVDTAAGMQFGLTDARGAPHLAGTVSA